MSQKALRFWFSWSVVFLAWAACFFIIDFVNGSYWNASFQLVCACIQGYFARKYWYRLHPDDDDRFPEWETLS